MSGETQDQSGADTLNTQQEPAKWNEIVEGYETPEALASAFKELKEKSGQREALPQDETKFVERVKSFFGDTLQEASSLEDSELATITNELRDEVGVNRRILDAAVAKTAARVLRRDANVNIQACQAFLGDEVNKKAVSQALQAMEGTDYAKSYGDRLKAGKITSHELQLLSERIKVDGEAGEGFKEEETAGKEDLKALEAELYDILDNKGDIYNNPNYPDQKVYKEVTERIHTLKRKLGAL